MRPVARRGSTTQPETSTPRADELVQHEATRGVVAEHADEGDAQSQPGRTAGHDRRRAADRQRAALHERLGLAEGDLAGDVADDDVGHGVAGDEQVERPGAPVGAGSGDQRSVGHLDRASCRGVAGLPASAQS